MIGFAAAALGALAGPYCPAALGGGPGSAALQMLKLDTSPRALGMAGAFTAVAEQTAAQVSIASYPKPVIPLTPAQ